MNILYSLAQSGYWMGLCACFSCAAVFLQGRSYSNTELGLIVASGSVLAFLLSPVLGGIVDRSERLAARHMLLLLLLAQGLLIAALSVFPGRSAAVSVCYSLYIAVNTCLAPLLTQLCFDMEEYGCSINFGIARGIGSLTYAVVAVILGQMIQRRSPALLLPAGVILTVFEILVILVFSVYCRRNPVTAARKTAKEKSSSMTGFLRDNRYFCALMVGVACLFFGHQLAESFLINLVRNVGGDTGDMGNISAFMAVVELPAMMLYTRISRRWGCDRLVRIAVVFFTVKALGIALSSTLPVLYAVHIFQAVSYALLTPALVEYVELYIPHRDSARAQSLSYVMTTLGSAFASLLGGRMYDSMSVRATLFVGVTVSALGLGICLFFSRRQQQAAQAEMLR